MTPYQESVVRMLWSTATSAAGQMQRPEPYAPNYDYAPIAAYHRARRAIGASGPGMTDWIAGRAVHEMARIVRTWNNPQPALFGPGEAPR